MTENKAPLRGDDLACATLDYIRDHQEECCQGSHQRCCAVNAENRALVVFTEVLLQFRMEASHWAPSYSPDKKTLRARIYRKVPDSAQCELIAEFPDVHAVYFEGDVTLVKPDEDN